MKATFRVPNINNSEELRFNLRVTDNQNQNANDSLNVRLENTTEKEILECTIPTGYGSESQEDIIYVQLNESERQRRSMECTGEFKIAFHEKMDEPHALDDEARRMKASFPPYIINLFIWNHRMT